MRKITSTIPTFQTKSPQISFYFEWKSIFTSCGFIFKNYCAANVCFFFHFTVTTAHNARSRLLSSLSPPPPPKKKVVVVVVISLSSCKEETHMCRERERAVCPLATSHHPLCVFCCSLPQIQLLTTKRGTELLRLLLLLAHRLYQVKVYLISKEEEEKEKIVVFIDWRRLPGCGRANDVRPNMRPLLRFWSLFILFFFPSRYLSRWSRSRDRETILNRMWAYYWKS